MSRPHPTDPHDELGQIDASPAPPEAPVSTQLKGRGTAWAIAHRFETRTREAAADGWGAADGLADADDVDTPGAPRTEVRVEQARRILCRNDSPDVPFELSINPYRGCEHGCIFIAV